MKNRHEYGYVILMGECEHCGRETRLHAQLSPVHPSQTLTSRQKEVYDAIRKYRDEHGVVPTYTTLAELIGVRSMATVHEMLRTLESKGWLQLNGGAQSMILRGE